MTKRIERFLDSKVEGASILLLGMRKKRSIKRPVRKTRSYSKQDMFNVLRQVPDPELGVSIVDLGLIYDATIDSAGRITVLMTLTTLGCPLFDEIKRPMEEKLGALPGITGVTIELTFDPPWSADRMSKEAKIQMGFLE